MATVGPAGVGSKDGSCFGASCPPVELPYYAMGNEESPSSKNQSADLFHAVQKRSAFKIKRNWIGICDKRSFFIELVTSCCGAVRDAQLEELRHRGVLRQKT